MHSCYYLLRKDILIVFLQMTAKYAHINAIKNSESLYAIDLCTTLLSQTCGRMELRYHDCYNVDFSVADHARRTVDCSYNTGIHSDDCFPRAG